MRNLSHHDENFIDTEYQRLTYHNFHSYFLPYFFLHCIFDLSIIRINIIIATVLCSAESWYDIEEFGRSTGQRGPRTITYVSES